MTPYRTDRRMQEVAAHRCDEAAQAIPALLHRPILGILAEAPTRVDPPTAVASFEVAAWLAAHPDTEVMLVAQAFDLLVEAQAACGFATRSESEDD